MGKRQEVTYWITFLRFAFQTCCKDLEILSTSVQSEAVQWRSLSALNNFVASIMLLKESVDMEINASVWFRWMKKKTSSLIKDKRKDKAHRAHTCQNPKRHIPPVNLLLWHKMVTVRCFVWALGLRLWSVSW